MKKNGTLFTILISVLLFVLSPSSFAQKNKSRQSRPSLNSSGVKQKVIKPKILDFYSDDLETSLGRDISPGHEKDKYSELIATVKEMNPELYKNNPSEKNLRYAFALIKAHKGCGLSHIKFDTKKGLVSYFNLSGHEKREPYRFPTPMPNDLSVEDWLWGWGKNLTERKKSGLLYHFTNSKTCSEMLQLPDEPKAHQLSPGQVEQKAPARPSRKKGQGAR